MPFTLNLHDLSPSAITEKIKTFVKYQFSLIKKLVLRSWKAAQKALQALLRFITSLVGDFSSQTDDLPLIQNELGKYQIII